MLNFLSRYCVQSEQGQRQIQILEPDHQTFCTSFHQARDLSGTKSLDHRKEFGCARTRRFDGVGVYIKLKLGLFNLSSFRVFVTDVKFVLECNIIITFSFGGKRC